MSKKYKEQKIKKKKRRTTRLVSLDIILDEKWDKHVEKTGRFKVFSSFVTLCMQREIEGKVLADKRAIQKELDETKREQVLLQSRFNKICQRFYDLEDKVK